MPFLADPTKPSTLTRRMMEAVQSGAREALRHRMAGLRAHHKSEAEGDIVTQGDQASQAAIYGALPEQAVIAGRREPVGFFGEEAMSGYVFPNGASWRWCADPVDGTKPYYNGEHYWSVSLALQQYQPDEDCWHSKSGVVYRATASDAPDRLDGVLYWAEEGRGAFAVTVESGSQVRLARPDAIAPVVEFEANPEVSTPQTLSYAKQAAALLDGVGLAYGFRRSICHAVCEMLEGEKMAVIQGVAGPFDWDIAAIALIVAEAGAHSCFEPRVRMNGCWRYPAIMAWDKALFERLVAIVP